MTITSSKLIRWAGFSAMLAGIIFAGIQPFHPADEISSVGTPLWMLITSLKSVMSIFGLLGVAGLYARQVEQTGWLGLLGFLSITIFYAVQMCYSFAEPLILPLLLHEAPTFVRSTLEMASGNPTEMNLGAFATIFSLISVVYLLGTLLFGIALFRARVVSRWASALFALGGPIALVMVTFLPHQQERLAAIPMGIALAWLGLSLMRERR